MIVDWLGGEDFVPVPEKNVIERAHRDASEESPSTQAGEWSVKKLNTFGKENTVPAASAGDLYKSIQGQASQSQTSAAEGGEDSQQSPG